MVNRKKKKIKGIYIYIFKKIYIIYYILYIIYYI